MTKFVLILIPSLHHAHFTINLLLMNYENIHSNSKTKSWIPDFSVKGAKENDLRMTNPSLANGGPSSHEIPLNVTRYLTTVKYFQKFL